MSYIRNSIVVENKVEELLSMLPIFVNPITFTEHVHTFKKGPESEINAFLSKKSDCYPLIWLTYPFTEEHSKRKVKVRNITFVIALPGDVTTFFDDRFESVFKDLIDKIFNNIVYLLEKASNIKITSDFKLTKFPNYSKQTIKDADPIYVWDAVKVSFDCIINDFKSNITLQLDESQNTAEGGGVVTQPDDTSNTTGVPVISPSSTRYYFELGTEIRFYVPATNNPTSYTVFGLIDGLVFDEVEGLITGTVVGDERLDSMAFTASNQYGTSSEKIIFFSLINDDATVFHAPDNVHVSRLDKNEYLLNWVYRPYSGGVNGIEIYKNDLPKSILEQQIGGSRSTGVLITNPEGYKNKFRVRFRNQDNIFSSFSNEILVDFTSDIITYEADLNEQIESANGVPFFIPTQVYYIQIGVETTFDFSNYTYNNPDSYIMSSFFGSGSNATTGFSFSIEGSFDNATGIMTCLATGDLIELYSELGRSALLQASNSNGYQVDYGNFKFKFTTTDPNLLSPPIDLSVSNKDTDDGAYLTWGYAEYNKLITEVEIYLNNEFYRNVINMPGYKNIGISLNGILGENTLKLRCKNEDGILSEFSQDITFTV